MNFNHNTLTSVSISGNIYLFVSSFHWDIKTSPLSPAALLNFKFRQYWTSSCLWDRNSMSSIELVAILKTPSRCSFWSLFHMSILMKLSLENPCSHSTLVTGRTDRIWQSLLLTLVSKRYTWYCLHMHCQLIDSQ